MTRLESYLLFDGTCAEAMRFYETILGGKTDLLPVAGSPAEEQMGAHAADRTLHARLVFGTGGGGVLMASDWLAAEPYPGMSGFSLSLGYPTIEEARRVFDTLAEGGHISMPFQPTFWSPGFGMLNDRFGTPWMVASGPDTTANEGEKSS
jgi:PhnB protein